MSHFKECKKSVQICYFEKNQRNVFEDREEIKKERYLCSRL